MSEWDPYFKEHRAAHLAELKELLAIPSISALPEHAGDVRTAATWVAERLRTAGAEHVEILETGGHPVVYGDWLHAAGRPTVLIYGHFDVQPVDPLEGWTTPPFEPTERDGRLYARGASDMKGNLLITILAIEALLARDGALPVNVKFFYEGQEEIGSPQVPAFMAANRERFAADLVVSADGGQWGEDQPVVDLAKRGGCGIQIDVHGPAGDLHSGMSGGAAPNPNHAVAQLVASLKGPDGKILVDGFYDDVVPLTPEDREQMARVPFDPEELRARLDVPALVTEPGYTALEGLWARPTLDVVGIWGGFQGEGVKTVIPSEAHAKVTCRLVPKQDPAKIVTLLQAHVQRHAPPGFTVTTQPLGFTAQPYYLSPNHPAATVLAGVLHEEYGTEPYYVRVGGSVPVCEIFLTHLRAPTITLGFGMNDEQIHAPNEFWRLSSFERGPRTFAALLQRLTDVAPA